jgi:hypothetical protein
MKHETEVKKYNGSTHELAEDIGNLRYDSLAQLLFKLSVKLEQDGITNIYNKKKELSAQLLFASSCLEDACDYINDVYLLIRDVEKYN